MCIYAYTCIIYISLYIHNVYIYTHIIYIYIWIYVHDFSICEGYFAHYCMSRERKELWETTSKMMEMRRGAWTEQGNMFFVRNPTCYLKQISCLVYLCFGIIVVFTFLYPHVRNRIYLHYLIFSIYLHRRIYSHIDIVWKYMRVWWVRG